MSPCFTTAHHSTVHHTLLRFITLQFKTHFSAHSWFISVVDRYPFSIFFFIPCAQLAGTVRPRCYRRSTKAYKKALTHLKDHSLRPIQETQMISGPFGTTQKRLEAFWTSNTNLATWKLFSNEGAQQFTESLKWLCADNNKKLQMVYDINLVKRLSITLSGEEKLLY